MPTRTVAFEVTSKNGTQAFWIAVGDKDVRLVNGKGEVDLPSGGHMLVWWFIGNPGGTLSIVGKVGGKVVVEVGESKIPKKRTQGAGIRPFTV